MATSESGVVTKRFGFVLLHDFTLVSFSSAISPLRMANRLTGTPLYHWNTISDQDEIRTSSDGVDIICSETLASSASKPYDILFVCGGVNVEKNTHANLLKWLRSMHQRGVALGAICTGSYVLAKAGLLDGHKCSVHWENVGQLRETFPRVQVSDRVFTLDRGRFTSTGGTAPFDMMLRFISAGHGEKLAAEIADQMVADRIRRESDKQRIPLRHLLGNQSDKLISTVELMEANIREPIAQKDLAQFVGLSERQLQRLFRKHLLCPPSRYYLQLRLARSRELLQQTSQSILEISSVCGFISPSHFSKSYKEHYGYSPSQERQRSQMQDEMTG
ncbi:MAG: GlxA family transcriptional regulator [Gammaproteobacteria bacterium]